MYEDILTKTPIVGDYVKFKDDIDLWTSGIYHEYSGGVYRIQEYETETTMIYCANLLWNKHVIEKIVTKEENPEYFL